MLTSSLGLGGASSMPAAEKKTKDKQKAEKDKGPSENSQAKNKPAKAEPARRKAPTAPMRRRRSRRNPPSS